MPLLRAVRDPAATPMEAEPMTADEYLDALRAAALAGDRKAAAFLDRYASRLVELPTLPSTSADAATAHPALVARQA